MQFMFTKLQLKTFSISRIVDLDMTTVNFNNSLQPIAIFLHSLVSHLDCHLFTYICDMLLQFCNVPRTSAVDFGLDEVPQEKFTLTKSARGTEERGK